MDFFFGMLFGFMLGFFAGILIFLSSGDWFNKDEIIIYKTDNGLVCQIDKDYPKINCQLIKQAIGTKFIEKPIFKTEINND